MGGRAYRARTLALAQHQSHLDAQRSAVSTAGPLMSERSNSAQGPMAGGMASSRILPQRQNSSERRYQDEEEVDEADEVEHEDHEEADVNAGGYYGFDGPSGRLGRTWPAAPRLN